MHVNTCTRKEGLHLSPAMIYDTLVYILKIVPCYLPFSLIDKSYLYQTIHEDTFHYSYYLYSVIQKELIIYYVHTCANECTWNYKRG